MSRRFVPVLVLVAACAPPAPSPEAPNPMRDRVMISAAEGGGGMEREIHTTDETHTRPVSAPAVDVLRVLPAVMQDLGLSITAVDSVSGVVRGELLRTRRPFGGKTLAQLLDCGSTAAGPTAARYQINLTITSRVLPAAEGSADVATIVQAVAMPNTTSGSPVRCRPGIGFAEIIATRAGQATRSR